MNRKLFLSCVIAIGVTTLSCRSSDENLGEESLELTQKTARDTVSLDPPPKDGTHWRITSKKDSTNVPSKEISLLKNDSLKGNNTNVGIDDNGPKVPPRDGTHWRVR